MGKTLRKCLCLPVKTHEFKVCNILMLGLSGSGKTELGHVICSDIREDFAPTNGVRQFKRCHNDLALNISEIGGNKDMKKIWHHYYSKAISLIFTIDISNVRIISNAFETLEGILRHRFAKGKPILVVITKLDLTDQFDLHIVEEKLESMANRHKTPMLMVVSEPNNHKEVFEGLDWVLFKLRTDYKKYIRRLEYEARVIEFEKSAIELSNIDEHKENFDPFRPLTAPTRPPPIGYNSSGKNVRLRWILVGHENAKKQTTTTTTTTDNNILNNNTTNNLNMNRNPKKTVCDSQIEPNKIDAATDTSENQYLPSQRKHSELSSGDNVIHLKNVPKTPSPTRLFDIKKLKNNRVDVIHLNNNSTMSDC